MRNQIDLAMPPEALFLNPGRDAGFAVLAEPAQWWRLRKPSVIEGFAASADDGMNAGIDAEVRQAKRHRSFSQVVEFACVPVLLTAAEFRKSHASAGGKCLLNGASGARLLNRYAGDGDAIQRYFADCQAANAGVSLPVSSLPEGVDFAIECRNTFNYFHFLTETLGQLCVLDGLGFKGRVFIHFPNHESKTRGFTGAFVAALFPELAGRVVFERAPKSYDRVISAFDTMLTYFQMPPDWAGSLDALAPSDLAWHGHAVSRLSRATLAMNSVDSGLLALRARALRAIEGRDFSHLPKRVYIARAPGQARDRRMKGEAALVDLLTAFGFVSLSFESLTPLEQIALMARAEIMVSQHGAGFANMLFASPDATVIEIGTLQTAQIRWGDFWPLAHASGCRYVTFFADHDRDDPLREPDFAVEGIVPVHLTDRGLGRVMAYVAALCDQIPRLARPADVARLAGQLLDSGHLDRAEAVLERHRDMQPGDVDLCLLQADLHKRRRELGGELVALHAAWQADPSRWQTLVQMLWCARSGNNLEVMIWVIRLMQAEFPDRLAELAKGRDWMQQLL
ncbi:MAG: DUF563 domain-containing protein [Rhodobacteraceae bacterium]|nr:DUF563 domain-containing protein [Paracoccaceae bacterium]